MRTLSKYSEYICKTTTMLFLTIIAADGVEFNVSGTLSLKFAGTHGWTNFYQFSASVHDCRWLIKTRPINGVEYGVTAGFDGNDIYTVLDNGTIPNANPNRLEANVFRSVLPFYAPYPVMPVVWTAFAQSCYLNSETRGRLVAGFDTSSKRKAVPVTLRRNSDDAGLPIEIAFFDEGFDRSQNLARPAPYSRGFTNALYLAKGFTNLTDAVSVPMRFQLTILEPAPNGISSNDLSAPFIYTAIVTNASPKSSVTEFVPRLPKGQSVLTADMRFDNLRAPIRYNSENGWLPVSDVRKLTEFRQWLVGNPEFDNSITKFRKIFFVGVTAFAVLSTLVFVGKRKRSAKP